MADKIKKGEHGLPLTEGQFKVRGLVLGKKKESFFKQKTQTNGFERNTVNFGVKTSTDNEVYVEISDSEKEDAWFYKKAKNKGETGESKKISWAQRKNFKEEGFEPIGVTIGLEKDANNKNIQVNMFDFDAAEYLAQKLEDDKAVLITGELEFGSYETENGTNRSKRMKIKKIFNSSVDFNKDDFKEESHFKQKCLFMEVSQVQKDGKPDATDPRWIVKAKIVTYKKLEDMEFIIRNKELASNFRKHLKPYNRISIFGKINNARLVENVVTQSNDSWGGESDPFDHVNNPRKLEFEISGIDTKDIDTKTYSEDIITKSFKAQDEFGSDDPWKDNGKSDISDNDGEGEIDW